MVDRRIQNGYDKGAENLLGGAMGVRVVAFAGEKRTIDHGTPERWRHSGKVLETTESAGVLAARAMEEDILDVLVAKMWITEIEREAGLRFKGDFHAAGMSQRLVGSYNPTRCSFSFFSGWDERDDEEEEAYQRWRLAVKAVGIQYSDVVITVVCHDKAPSAQKMRGLKDGLGRLAKWYRMGKNGE